MQKEIDKFGKSVTQAVKAVSQVVKDYGPVYELGSKEGMHEINDARRSAFLQLSKAAHELNQFVLRVTPR